MNMKELLPVKGYFKATHICTTKDGEVIPFDPSFVARKDINVQDVERWNLVVNSGRNIMARSLGGFYQTADPAQVPPYINRITLGEGAKGANPPNLSDTGLIQEITNLAGTTSGTFLLNGPNDGSPEITFPSQTQRWPLSGDFTANNATISINGDGETILEDVTVDFINTIDVQLTDQITINNSVSNPLVFGVREVRSTTELVLHNPTGFTGAGLGYRVATPGTQMLVSKLLSGNDFTVANYGDGVVVHEAGLLYNTSVLFNRVTFAPQDEEIGILLQSDENTGVEISVRFEWLITV